MKAYNVAIVGATGLVGSTFIKVLEEYNFPIKSIKLLASRRSAGKKIMFMGKEVVVEELTENSFEGVELALFSAGGEISKKYAPIAKEAGARVIDNSSAWRNDPEIPLIVDANCCAGVTPQSHQTALNSLKTCQIKVINE